jgi:hypothetical protein
LPFTEDFSGTPLVACTPSTGGWVTTSAASGAGWWIPSPATNEAGGTAPEIEAYGDQANGGVNETISLTSPPMNTSAVSSYTLSFKHNLYLSTSGGAGSNIMTLTLESSPDNATWTQQWQNTYVVPSSLASLVNETRTITVSSGIAATTYFRFSVNGVLFKLTGWEIDDVNLDGTTGTTGIAQIRANKTMVSPNPFSDLLVVNNEQGGLVTVSDVLGKVVFAQQAAVGQLRIDTKDFPTGMYIVRTHGPAGISSTKVIKN